VFFFSNTAKKLPVTASANAFAKMFIAITRRDSGLCQTAR
jgi:hypothetical protein